VIFTVTGQAACPNFINVDLFAAGLAPFKPAAAAVQAGRLLLREMRRYARRLSGVVL
jgi:predicted ABC-type ATPase